MLYVTKYKKRIIVNIIVTIILDSILLTPSIRLFFTLFSIKVIKTKNMIIQMTNILKKGFIFIMITMFHKDILI